MDRLIYTSLTAMRGAMDRQAATANNLANAQTPGFRADMAEARAKWLDGSGHNSRAVSAERVLGADMASGSVVATGRDLDIAIVGDGLLAVQAGNGEDAYTRRGDLQLSDTGLLTTGDGYPVLGGQGTVAIPPADRVSIDPDGRIWIVPQGGDPAQPQELDRLKLTSTAGAEIAKGLDGLFRAKDDAALPEDPDARLISGSLESSNVKATSALVEMIEASRAWDMQLKMLGNVRDLDDSTASLMQLPQ